jgi:hypothetical protein
MSPVKPIATPETAVRVLNAEEVEAVSGAEVRYYVMKGTWWVCGTNRNGEPTAVNTGIPAT